MSYLLGGEEYSSKGAVKTRLKAIKTKYKGVPHQALGKRSVDLLTDLLPHLRGKDVTFHVGSERDYGLGGSRTLGFYVRWPQGIPYWSTKWGGVTRKAPVYETAPPMYSPYERLPVTDAINALGKTRTEYGAQKAIADFTGKARSIIAPQVTDYRQSYNLPKGWDVDHVGTSFQALLDDWLDTLPRHETYDDLGRFRPYRMGDVWWTQTLAANWAHFHRQRAILQGLPSATNRAKGGDARRPRPNLEPLPLY